MSDALDDLNVGAFIRGYKQNTKEKPDLSVLENINWELLGEQFNASSSSEKDTDPKDMEDATPEEILPFIEELIAIKQRYYNGAAMNRRIDCELQQRLCAIYDEIEKQSPLSRSDDVKAWISIHKTNITKTCFLGAFTATTVYYRNPVVTISDDIKVAIKSRLHELELLIKELPSNQQEEVYFHIGLLRVILSKEEIREEAIMLREMKKTLECEVAAHRLEEILEREAGGPMARRNQLSRQELRQELALVSILEEAMQSSGLWR
jgi:hypothetical protein